MGKAYGPDPGAPAATSVKAWAKSMGDAAVDSVKAWSNANPPKPDRKPVELKFYGPSARVMFLQKLTEATDHGSN